MSGKPLEVLLRVGLELLNRSAATRRYLEKIGPGDTGEHRQLIQTIRIALDGVEQLLPQTIDSVIKFLPKGEPDRELGFEVLASYLTKFAHWFKTIHELLVYLPRQPITPETVSALAASFGEVYKAYQPSIILGSLFNALEFDFFQIVRDRLPDIDTIVVEDAENIVLQLAICDRDSPHAWAILAHEMGHAIDLRESISQKITDRFVTDPSSQAYQLVRSWSGELCADLLAAKAFGPSSILALLSLVYCILPLTDISSPSTTHPATRWRLDVVSRYLKEQYGDSALLEEETLLYRAAAEYSLVRAAPESEARKVLRALDSRQFDSIILPIAEELYEAIQAVPIPQHTIFPDSLERCLVRLRQNLPVSAQGLPRANLRANIASYRQLHFESKADRQKHFEDLVGRFKEEPLEMPTIFLSGFQRRHELIQGACSQVSQLSEPERLESLCADLWRLDQLIASSINTSSVHMHIRRLEYRSGLDQE